MLVGIEVSSGYNRSMKSALVASFALAACLIGRSLVPRALAEPKPAKQGAQPRHSKTLAAFRVIRREMARSQVHALVGKPDSITGSGLYIEVYALKDKSKVWVGWDGPFKNSRLLYVRHRSQRTDRDLLKATRAN